MLDRLQGFWESLVHFFSFLGDLMVNIAFFVPPYVQGALYMLVFVATTILAIKIVKGLIDIIKTVLTTVFFFAA